MSRQRHRGDFRIISVANWANFAVEMGAEIGQRLCDGFIGVGCRADLAVDPSQSGLRLLEPTRKIVSLLQSKFMRVEHTFTRSRSPLILLARLRARSPKLPSAVTVRSAKKVVPRASSASVSRPCSAVQRSRSSRADLLALSNALRSPTSLTIAPRQLSSETSS